jgi:hypothetical protein
MTFASLFSERTVSRTVRGPCCSPWKPDPETQAQFHVGFVWLIVTPDHLTARAASFLVLRLMAVNVMAIGSLLDGRMSPKPLASRADESFAIDRLTDTSEAPKTQDTPPRLQAAI